MSTHRPSTASRDAQWLAGLRAGRFDVFREIFDAFVNPLWRFARQSVEHDIAEDIVQDVLFDLWRRRNDVHMTHGFDQYLFGAVRNRVIKYLRRQNVVARADTSLGQLMDTLPESDTGAMEEDVNRAVYAALSQLTELQRAVLTLRWEEEMTYEQIAAVLSISSDAVRQHASRGLRAVRPVLERIAKGGN